MANIMESAEKNLETRYVQNPCRGLVIGQNEEGVGYHVAWIMGRSQPSQMRRYESDGGSSVGTIALNAEGRKIPSSQVENAELIIYKAMLQSGDYHIVGNGRQTETLQELLKKMPDNRRLSAFETSMLKWDCEPDPPNFTARIVGMQKHGEEKAYFGVTRRNEYDHKRWQKTIRIRGMKQEDFESKKAFNNRVSELSDLDWENFLSIRERYMYDLQPGIGYSVTTYKPGHPQELLPFTERPFPVPIRGSIDEVLETYWERLEPQWRVAIAVKEIPQDPNQATRIITMDKWREAV